MKSGLKLFLLFVYIIVISNLNAQNINKAFELYKQKEYKQSIEAFKKVIAKKKNVIEAKYGLALVYSDTNYKKYNYSRAYKYSTSTIKKYIKLNETEKNDLLKFNISQESILRLKNNILESAFKEVKVNPSVKSYDDFIRSYKNTRYSVEATSLRNSLAFKICKNQNSRFVLSDFIRLYPDAKEVDSAKTLLKTYGQKAFQEHTFEGELDLIEKFEKLYPDFVDRNSLNKEKVLAFEAFRLELDKPYNILMHNAYSAYIKKAAPRELAFVALKRLISPNLIEKKWQLAIDTLNKYKKYFKSYERINNIINIISKPSKNLKTESFSRIINSIGHEYAPVISVDGKTLYFCGVNRRYSVGLEDIFVSKLINGNWTEPKLISRINTKEGYEAPLAISADGNRLIVYNNSDIYYSDKTSSGWSYIRKFPSINTDFSWEADAMLSSDGKSIIFVSDRKGNIGQHHVFGDLFHGGHKGNLDLYVSTKTINGWSKPINLGKTINTPYAERGPFLHPDMKTLYFSSDGHNGVGELDVFKSTRLNDSSWTEWTEPINMGKAVNTSGNNYDYKITTDGKYAILASFNNGNWDIQKMEIPLSMRPDKVAIISGTIKNKQEEALKATMKWEDLKTGEIMGVSESDITDDGKYLVTLPLGKNYGYFIEHKNYYPQSGNIDLTKQKDQIEITKNFILLSYVEIINNQLAIPLENVFFDHNKSNLKQESHSELNRLIQFINRNHDLNIEIGGHTDNSGSSDYNKKLSQKRAESVKQYLISKGIKTNMLVSKGYGETVPISENTTDHGKAKNRRVEFKVLK